MRSLLFTLLLVPTLSFAAPALNTTGKDPFCDDRPPDKTSDEPHGGGCEVDMVVSDKAGPDAQLHDLAFDAPLLTRLDGAFGFQIWTLDLDSGTGVEKEEALLVELSFVSAAGPGAGGRLLALSFSRNQKDVAIVANWLETPYAGWSFSDAQLFPARKLTGAVLPLGPAEATSFPDVDIGFGETGVLVAVHGGPSQFFAFPASWAQWKPYHLRNGFVIGDQIKSSIGVVLNWPLLYHY